MKVPPGRACGGGNGRAAGPTGRRGSQTAAADLPLSELLPPATCPDLLHRVAAGALQRADLREALVASYVWGKGKRGTPAGSGPATLSVVLAAALAMLRTRGSQHAYAELEGKVRGFGPAFFTKFLYFAATAVPPALDPKPLILDSVLAARMRSMAEVVGRDTGHDPHGKIAAWVWSDGAWTPHRYQVYLSFMEAAARQMAATDGWPSHAHPDLLEYALFNTTWQSRS
ncbi:8-oxoguanine DNA glycosylase OGG fold protein [Actinacidiphila rubida]|uniref:8-oxoguanine DNA glycosylase OGG fold protein n=1 Tax=Actinacidiphila rubida TaxID=310780 RepID=UPI002B0030B2|nr:hypothetical protein [Actinacidiphila rubida]